MNRIEKTKPVQFEGQENHFTWICDCYPLHISIAVEFRLRERREQHSKLGGVFLIHSINCRVDTGEAGGQINFEGVWPAIADTLYISSRSPGSTSWTPRGR